MGDNRAIFRVASHIDLPCCCSDSLPPARERETMLMYSCLENHDDSAGLSTEWVKFRSNHLHSQLMVVPGIERSKPPLQRLASEGLSHHQQQINPKLMCMAYTV